MKKIMFVVALLAAVALQAAEPKCELKSEYWGRQYIQLTDVNGFTYKVNVPAAGKRVKIVTRTGWYLIDSSAKIIEYKDTSKGK